MRPSKQAAAAPADRRWLLALLALSLGACSSRAIGQGAAGGGAGASGGGGPGGADSGTGGVGLRDAAVPGTGGADGGISPGTGGGPDCTPYLCYRDGCRVEQAAFDTPSSWITVTGPTTLSLSAGPAPPLSVAFHLSDYEAGDPYIPLADLTSPPWTMTFQPTANGRFFLWGIVAASCGYNGHAALTIDVQQPGIAGDAFPRLRLVDPYFVVDSAQQTASGCQARQVLAVADDDHASPVVQLFADGVQVAQTTADPALFQLPQPATVVRVVAVDSAGQQMERTMASVPYGEPCPDSPVAALVAPRDGATVRGPVTLTAMSSDPTQTVAFTAEDGTGSGRWDLGTATAASSFSVTWETGALPEGDYTLFVFFTDPSLAASDRVHVHVAR